MSKKRRTTSGRARTPGGGSRSGPADPGHLSADRARPHPRQPSRFSARSLLLVGGGVVALVIAVAVVVLGQGAGPTGLGALRSPTTAPMPSPSRSAASTSASASSSASVGAIASSGITTISGVNCDPREQVTYHVHAHLNIRVNGQLEVIPGDVGRTETCYFWLHTHATQGVIHVEAPARKTFTLGQFFDVWGKPLDATRVGDWTVPTGSQIWVFVDRQPVDVDPRTIELTNLAAIELQIGPSRLDPLPYTWPAEYL